MDDEIYIDDASLLTEFRSIVDAMESRSIVEENPRNRSSVSPVKASTFSAEKTAKILRMFARVVTLGSMDFFANHKRRILGRRHRRTTTDRAEAIDANCATVKTVLMIEWIHKTMGSYDGGSTQVKRRAG